MVTRWISFTFALSLVVFGSAGPASAQYLSCVQYLRTTTHFQLAGNAWTWWDRAAAIHKRGSRPEAASVLVFRSATRMTAGHVALVRSVEDPRLILIDHSNWAQRRQDKGKIALRVPVRDVSERNDWTKVQVWNEQARSFGNTYYTYGFIYKGDEPRGTPRRAPSDTMVADASDAEATWSMQGFTPMPADHALADHALTEDLLGSSVASTVPFIPDPEIDHELDAEPDFLAEVGAERASPMPARRDAEDPVDSSIDIFGVVCKSGGCESTYPAHQGS